MTRIEQINDVNRVLRASNATIKIRSRKLTRISTEVKRLDSAHASSFAQRSRRKPNQYRINH